jgi:diadenosine tetraphosphate (Ap4A) HIT family hydrolase
MSRPLFGCAGGRLVLPDRTLVLVDRRDGGNLIVDPPRPVWDRSALAPAELSAFSFLVAAAGRAMMEALPQLDGGCVNYWDAGNWALHEDAEPPGPKRGPTHRRLHLHLLGRSRTASDPDWRWGEAPRFPDFASRHAWASRFERLTPPECRAVVERVSQLLTGTYGMRAEEITPSLPCPVCGYPAPAEGAGAPGPCAECRTSAR